MPRRVLLPALALLAVGCVGPADNPGERTIVARVVALDQPIVYNRFGSFNPYGHIYALERDVVATGDGRRRVNGSESFCPGEVRLRDGKRPRPLVLRGNVGDTLEISFENLLTPGRGDGPDAPGNLDLSGCTWRPDPHYARSYAKLGEPDAGAGEPGHGADVNWPATRRAAITVVGLTPESDGSDLKATGIAGIAPGESTVYRYELHRPGTFFFYSNAAPAGGEGEGGSLTHGLFGVIQVEPAGSRWFRSQVTAEDWAAMAPAGGWPDGRLVDYFAVARRDDPARGLAAGDPLAAMLKRADGLPGACDREPGASVTCELVHGDINAVVHECPTDLPAGSPRDPSCAGEDKRARPSFREFVVVFHDELKTFYADAFQELEEALDPDGFNALAGVRDGFAINYGASGLGTMLLANRKGIGPGARCVECAYEEFFLTSWVNGDPALLPQYGDDPSNVHHSYLNDRVEFRNVHAGPKETHVFHLHAHQWLAKRAETGEPETGSYLDSQTIAPLQAFTYPVYYGGSGNRNLTPGDSIFHCHLYPHFAQGMWALWRVHDALEDGTRRLPDGEFADAQGRSGTDPRTGRVFPDAAGGPTGTPVPAVVPLPGQAMPLKPTYGENGMPGYPFYIPAKPGHRPPQPPLDMAEDGGLPRHVVLEGARGLGDVGAEEVERALAEGRAEDLVRRALLTADFTAELEHAKLERLPAGGTPLERRAMAFHAGLGSDQSFQAPPVGLETVDGRRVEKSDVRKAEGLLGLARKKSYHRRGLPSVTPEGDRSGDAATFWVNGLTPKPGAPYADPCVAQDGGKAPERRYRVSAVGVDLVVNKEGWHDPQGRINVLTSEVDRYVTRLPTGDRPKTVGVGQAQDAKPFFFRAASGECVVFEHTNRTPKRLELDDFQMRVPTDTIGQHIHLVKFDVTSSDGSANGFNYEDGTFAPDAVHERLEAAHAPGGGAVDGVTGAPVALPRPSFDAEGRPILTGRYQTTVQRWYADPLLARDPASGREWDRTLRTVFTHDHFAPSNIQQHGFYSALLVEPAGSRWLTPDGREMPADRADSRAVGSQAIIDVDGRAPGRHTDHREFALAVADFALLYDPDSGRDPRVERDSGLDRQIAVATRHGLDQAAQAALRRHHRMVRDAWGRPVDPPALPEAISREHHNPYLVNYAHAPLPLRIASAEGQGGWRVKPGDEGDLARAFSSFTHGDPETEMIEGYAGETVQVRMVQGAQEVQHVFTIDGMSWRREINDRDDARTLRVPAQEIGISEHFEMQLPGLTEPRRELVFDDYLYRFASIDDLWNGAWGLMRVYAGLGSPDAATCPDPKQPYIVEGNIARPDPRCRRIRDRLRPVAGDRWTPAASPVNRQEFDVSGGACPVDAPKRRFGVEAWNVAELARTAGLDYDRARGIADTAGLAFLLVDEPDLGDGLATPERVEAQRRALVARLRAGEPLRPLVLRARAGECVEITLFNMLPDRDPDDRISDVPDDQESDRNGGQGMLPRITPVNAQHLRPSPNVTLGQQHAAASASVTPPAMVGFVEPGQAVASPEDREAPFGFLYQLYAGRVLTLSCDTPEGRRRPGCQPGRWYLDARPEALGTINLVSHGDVVEHGSQGLIGALVIEDEGVAWRDPSSCPGPDGRPGFCADPAAARPFAADSLDRTQALLVREGTGEPVGREFVVLYQDGLGLRHGGRPIPDCRICDDSYDLGEKGLNYATAPFWARFPQRRPDADLNGRVFPADFFVVPDADAKLGGVPAEARFGDAPTPRFRAVEGERLLFRLGQPAGRARQRAFVVLGHDYPDAGIERFGSAASSLVSAAKALSAEIPRARPGYWLYRDGPTQHFAGGAWGVLEVLPRGSGAAAVAEAP